MVECRIDSGSVSSIIDVLNTRANIQSDQPGYVFLSDGAERASARIFSGQWEHDGKFSNFSL
jgi:hypothetical protein